MTGNNITYSVILPAYNGRKYLGAALQSALVALVEEDEIAVIEDGSNDGGVEDIIHAVEDHRTRYQYQENCGVASALNHGLKIARNPYFAWLRHDDLFLPDRLSEDRQLSQLCPDIVTFTAFYLFSDDANDLNLVNKLKLATSHDFATRLLPRRFLNGCTVSAPSFSAAYLTKAYAKHRTTKCGARYRRRRRLNTSSGRLCCRVGTQSKTPRSCPTRLERSLATYCAGIGGRRGARLQYLRVEYYSRDYSNCVKN
ncbi:glycosyl transferase [Rhodobacteraceae bacterium HIMB11]|nr:glycosyl transferase [Rhodobacteraceae bacterium HIMB11]